MIHKQLGKELDEAGENACKHLGQMIVTANYVTRIRFDASIKIDEVSLHLDNIWWILWKKV